MLPSTLRLFKGGYAVGRQVHTERIVLTCISMPNCCTDTANTSYCRNNTEKLQRKGNSSVELLLPFFFNKAFHRYTSKLCSCYHREPSPIQAKHKKLFYWIHIFCFIMTALMLIMLSALQAQGQLRTRCHCNKPYPFSER